MKRNKRQWLISAMLLIGIAFVLQRLLATGEQLSWQSLGWTSLGMALAFAVAQELTNPWIAKFSLRSIQQDGGYLRLLVIVTTSATSNAMIPLPAGIPLRVWLQQRWLDIPYGHSISAALIESVVSYGTLAVAATMSLLLWAPEILNAVRSHAPWPLVVGTMAVTAIVALAGFRFIRRRSSSLVARFVHLDKPSPGWAALAGLTAALGILLAYWRLKCIGNALNATGVEWGLAFTGLVISRLAGVISMIPMGLGARDLSLGYFLILAGVHPETAAAWATLDRIAMTLPYVACGLISLPVVHRLRNHDDMDSLRT